MTTRRVWMGVPLSRWAFLGVVVLAAGVLSIAVRERLGLEWTVASLRAFVFDAGIWGPVVYIAILTFRFAVLVPSSILLTASGLCFGAVPGMLYATVGLTLSGLLKFAVATIAGRDVLLRQLPGRWRDAFAVGDRRATAGGLAIVCAYPFGPKHVFQIAAILSGISFGRYLLAIASGSNFRAGAFALLGDAVATGKGMLLVSLVLLGIAAIPLLVPRSRARLLPMKEITT